MIRNILSLLVVLAVAPAILNAAEVQGVVRKIDGSAQLIVDGATKTLKVGDMIPSGSTVKTGAGSTIEFTTVPGSTIKLGENSEFVVQKLEVVKISSTDSKKEAFGSLKAGTMTADVLERVENSSILEVTTPYGKLVAQEGSRVILTPLGILVEYGIATFTLTDGTVFKLEKGFFLDFDNLAQGPIAVNDIAPGRVEKLSLVDGGTLERLLNPSNNPTPNPTPGGDTPDDGGDDDDGGPGIIITGTPANTDPPVYEPPAEDGPTEEEEEEKREEEMTKEKGV